MNKDKNAGKTNNKSTNKKNTNAITRRTLFAGAGILSIAAGGFFLYEYSSTQEEVEQAPKDMQGNAISLEIPLEDHEIEKMDIQVEKDLHIKIDELGLDSKVSSMVSVEGVINPPDATQTYLLRDYGTKIEKPAEGTLYVVAHSLKSGIGPGNYLFDWQNDKILVKEGNVITIGKLKYKVSNVGLTEKTKINKHETIWDNDPNKLVFITCLQRIEGRSLQNLIVVADLVKE